VPIGTHGLEALDAFAAVFLDVELPGANDDYSLGDTLGCCDAAPETAVDREREDVSAGVARARTDHLVLAVLPRPRS
jgi:hypothetical protein